MDAGNTLGLSRDTIRFIERRTTQDKYILWGCVVYFGLLLLHLSMDTRVIRDGDCGDLYWKWTAVFVRYPEVEASAM